MLLFVCKDGYEMFWFTVELSPSLSDDNFSIHVDANDLCLGGVEKELHH